MHLCSLCKRCSRNACVRMMILCFIDNPVNVVLYYLDRRQMLIVLMEMLWQYL